MNMIEIKDLTKQYHSVLMERGRMKKTSARGIDHLTLTVPEGEIFGFIGPNGAGKSTTIRTLLGLIRPDSGQAFVLGRDIRCNQLDILSDTGYMMSESAFYSGMRVRDILQMSAQLHKKDCRAEAEKLCERLQLDVSRRAEELSLGNRKKVSIVCALQHMPRLYILDEPTSGLDPLIQKEFFTILEERRANGATVFLSSHVLSEIQRHCSRAAIIRDGRIIAEGKIEELASTGARRVTVHGVTEIDSTRLPGMRDIRPGDHMVSFLYQGEMNRLLSVLSGLPVSDLTVTEPDLEEVFLHYYG